MTKTHNNHALLLSQNRKHTNKDTVEADTRRHSQESTTIAVPFASAAS